MNKINTDIYNYLSENIGNGFPSMSASMRKISNPSIAHDERDSYYQKHPFKTSGLDYIQERKNIIENGRLGKYHRSLLEDINVFRLNFILSELTGIPNTNTNALNGLNDLLGNMECDVVLCSLRPDNTNYISLVHLVMPNEWSAEDAIGKTFQYMHENVKYPNKKHVLPMNDHFISGLINSNNVFERVGAYSLRENFQMDYHPEHRIESNYDDLKSLYLRFERQTIICRSDIQSFIFFIHSHFVDCSTNPDLFVSAIENSAEDCYLYKTIQNHGEKIVKFLKSF